VIRLVISGVCIVFLLSGNIFAAEREENDKDLKIMQLQQIIASKRLPDCSATWWCRSTFASMRTMKDSWNRSRNIRPRRR
jgi:hypothetical protein